MTHRPIPGNSMIVIPNLSISPTKKIVSVAPKPGAVETTRSVAQVVQLHLFRAPGGPRGLHIGNVRLIVTVSMVL